MASAAGGSPDPGKGSERSSNLQLEAPDSLWRNHRACVAALAGIRIKHFSISAIDT